MTVASTRVDGRVPLVVPHRLGIKGQNPWIDVTAGWGINGLGNGNDTAALAAMFAANTGAKRYFLPSGAILNPTTVLSIPAASSGSEFLLERGSLTKLIDDGPTFNILAADLKFSGGGELTSAGIVTMTGSGHVFDTRNSFGSNDLRFEELYIHDIGGVAIYSIYSRLRVLRNKFVRCGLFSHSLAPDSANPAASCVYINANGYAIVDDNDMLECGGPCVTINASSYSIVSKNRMIGAVSSTFKFQMENGVLMATSGQGNKVLHNIIGNAYHEGIVHQYNYNVSEDNVIFGPDVSTHGALQPRGFTIGPGIGASVRGNVIDATGGNLLAGALIGRDDVPDNNQALDVLFDGNTWIGAGAKVEVTVTTNATRAADRIRINDRFLSTAVFVNSNTFTTDITLNAPTRPTLRKVVPGAGFFDIATTSRAVSTGPLGITVLIVAELLGVFQDTAWLYMHKNNAGALIRTLTIVQSNAGGATLAAGNFTDVGGSNNTLAIRWTNPDPVNAVSMSCRVFAMGDL